MSPALQPLAPAIALLAYFLVALAVYAVLARRRPLTDQEVAARPASPLLGRYLRHYLIWVLSPYERLLVRARVPPNAVTLGSLALAAGGGVALAAGHFALGGWLYLATGICDILDGRVARATGRASRAGAYIDSVVDRYAELAIFGGLAWYYRGSPVQALVAAAAAGSLLVSYTRARGEALGVDVRVGTMQRPERLFYLGLTVALAPLVDALRTVDGRSSYPPAVVALGLLALSANATALRRVIHTVRHLEASGSRLQAPASEVPRPPASRLPPSAHGRIASLRLRPGA
jgi:phosphatidylglycerophosphate synthase